MKDNTNLKKIFTIVLSSFLILFLLVSFYIKLTESVITQTAYIETVTDTVSADMYIIRNEKYLYSDKNGVVASLISDGEKVGTDTTVGAVFSTEKDAEHYIKTQTLLKKLDIYEKINNQQRLANIDIDKLSSETLNSFLDVINSTYKNSYSNLNDKELSFDEKLSRMNISKDIEVDCSEQINDIKTEIDGLSGYKITDYIISGQAGFFIKNPDGYENILKVEDIDDLTKEDLENAFKSQKKQLPNNCIGKIIDGFNWYIACVLDIENSSTLNKGKKVSIYLGESDNEHVTAKVYSVKSIGNNQALVVFKCNEMNHNLSTLRSVKGKVVLKTYKGIKIPKDSVHFINDKQGVYILEGNIVKFNRINEIYSNEDFVVSSNSQEIGYIWQYDEIIISGRNLYSGKIIKR